MKYVLHPAHSRGAADHGWLKSQHSFSFANYYNPERMNFGALRVLNDDRVAPGKGFGAHPHQNMEIISIPLSGKLEHRDSTGTFGIISDDEVQVMSAGAGITHSEFNHSATDPVEFLQIWIMPKSKNITPRYGQKRFASHERLDKLQRLVSPLHDEGEGLKINQDAYLSRIKLNAGGSFDYAMQQEGHGLYAFVISGEIHTMGERLAARDAIGIEQTSRIGVTSSKGADVLFIEVPLNF